MKIIKKILYFLTPAEYKQFILLIVMATLMSLIEMVGIASIMPFLGVLMNPGLIETSNILNLIFQASSKLGIDNNQEFLFFLGVIVFIILLSSLSFRALTIYLQQRFIQMRGYSISKLFLEKYLFQPYSWFLDRNSADLGKTIIGEAQLIANQALSSLIHLLTYSIVVITLIFLLIITDPKLSLIISFFLGGSYLLIYLTINKHTHKIGKERLDANKLRFLSISETFGASKEIKVSGLEEVFINKFSNAASIFAKRNTSFLIISQFPRYAMEAFSFGGLILIILYLMKFQSFTNVIPLLALYAFAGYRLMPAIQHIYAAFTNLRYATPAVNSLYKDFKSLKQNKINRKKNIMKFDKSIRLKNIFFNYPNTGQLLLKNINLLISAGTTVGFIGGTGSGKTTLVDIILGLFEAQKGTLEVDGQPVTKKNLMDWQNLIGYVPQHIYLADDTIAANIAFGVKSNEINYNTIYRVAKIANLNDFVINQLPKKYQTTVGERGIRLSGGQRQRIGIARALYHNPKLLIFDEATSALDSKTEKKVMQSIYSLKNKITIILIAHRLNTLNKCDAIYELKNYKLVKSKILNKTN